MKKKLKRKLKDGVILKVLNFNYKKILISNN